MGYVPGYADLVPPMVSVFTKGTGWVAEDLAGTAPSSTTWASANRALYYPIILPVLCVARRVWWANGATATGGATLEVGIYANADYAPAAKLVSGSATQGTASEVQFVDVTDTVIGPGLYWIAIGSTASTNTTLFRSALTSTATSHDAAVMYMQASAMALPATATPVETVESNIWLCGFATTASP